MKTKHLVKEKSIFSVMSQMALRYNALNLSQGFPNFEVDNELIDLVNEEMVNGANQYAPMPGDPFLREVISNKIEKSYGRKYNPETEITITAGATQAIFCVIAATIEAGDEVIIFTPAYDCYKPTVELFGGKTITIQLKPPFFSPDWDEVRAKVTSKTKMIIVNTPQNPLGTLFSKDDMLQLEEIAEVNDLLVLSDEVYEHIIFDGEKHQSAARFEGLSNRTFLTASFGKTFHATGWKMGYCVAPAKFIDAFRNVHQFVVFAVNHPIQKAMARYLQNEENYIHLPQFYQQKRDLFLRLIKNSRFIYKPSKGTYFQLLDYSEITEEGDISFTERLTKEHGLATIPTSVFNKNREDFKLIRVCFAKQDETLEKAAEILNSI